MCTSAKWFLHLCTNVCLCVRDRAWAVRAAACQNVPCLQLQEKTKEPWIILPRWFKKSPLSVTGLWSDLSPGWRMDACVSVKSSDLALLSLNGYRLEAGLWQGVVEQTCAPRCQPCSGCRVAEQRSANLLQEELSGSICQCLWPSQGKDSVYLLCLHPGKALTSQGRNGWQSQNH